MRVYDYLHPGRGFGGIKHLSCEGVVSPWILTCLPQYDVFLHLCLQAALPAYKLGLMRICSLTQGVLAVFIKGCLSVEAPPRRRGNRGLRKLKPRAEKTQTRRRVNAEPSFSPYGSLFSICKLMFLPGTKEVESKVHYIMGKDPSLSLLIANYLPNTIYP